jgi:O-antigen/teichoic acid export membrane protein
VTADAHHRAQTYKRRAVSGVKWAGASSLLSTGFYLLQSIVLARLLEPRDFGLMAMAAVVISMALAYVDMGLSSAIVQRQHCTENELSSLYWLNIFAGLAVFAVIFAIAPIIARFYHEPRVIRVVQLSALTFVIAPVGAQYQLLLQKELLFRPLAAIEVISRGVGTVVAIVLAVMGKGVYALVFGQLTTSACNSLLLMRRGHRIYKPRRHFAWADVRSYLGFGLYQLGERAINTLHDNLDKMIIGFWLGAEMLGFYNFAWNLATLPISRINPILTRTAFPLFSRLQEDSALLSRGYFKLVRLVSLVNFPMFFGLCAMSGWFVPAVFGQKWEHAVPLIQVFCLFACGYAIGNPIGSLVLAKGRADLGFWWNAGIAIIQAIAVALSAWLGGALAVAVTLLALQVIYFPASYHFMVKPVLGRCWRQYALASIPALVSSLIMFGALRAALLLFPHRSAHSYWGLALLIALGGLVYLAVVFGLFGKETRELLKMILHRGPSPAAPIATPTQSTAGPSIAAPASRPEKVSVTGVSNPSVLDGQ